MEERLVQCTIHKPSYVAVNTNNSRTQPSRTGCSIISVTFPNALHADIDKIIFKNFYTASLSVYAKHRSMGARETDDDWKQCVRPYTLMPCPYSENSGEDKFTVKPNEPLKNVSELCLVLRQPSTMWKDFRIDDIQIYRFVPLSPSQDEETKKEELVTWLTSHNNLDRNEQDNEKVKATGSSVSEISTALQQLWALSETAAAADKQLNNSCSKLGRFDINGRYDINLLSYP